MKYDTIPIILKRYSFKEKMNILQMYSIKIMSINGVELKNDMPLPWELEIFLLFSVEALEYQQKTFVKHNNVFIDIINCIRNYIHPKISNCFDDKLVDSISVTLKSTQIDIQSYNIYKYYRYDYFFNYVNDKVNMKDKFKNKFGVEYESFLKFGFLLSFVYSLNVKSYNNILNYINLKYCDVVTELTISREDFSKKLNEFACNIDDYLYCVRPVNIFPFIEYEGSIYLPLPHCLTRSVTDSLLYRLTDRDNTLRSIIGKDVLEDYLYDIVYESKLYEEVLQEHEYYVNNDLMKTPDVMVKNGDEYLFFECKMSVPAAKVRILGESYLNERIERIGNYVKQLYNQMDNFCKNKFNFFNKKNAINPEKIFGVVVLLEESYINRDLIYNKVLEKNEMLQQQHTWLINHIKIYNLYEIERYMFTSTDLISNIKKQSIYDCFLPMKTNGYLKNENVKNFKKNLIEEINKLRNKFYLK